MPWLRPIVSVYLCSSARAFSAASTASRSASSRSAAWVSCTDRQVSSTSELVMPRCTKRLSSPTASASQVRKAITSCRVSRSIASIRSMSAGPIAASFGAALLADACARRSPGSRRSGHRPRPPAPRSRTRCDSGWPAPRWPPFRVWCNAEPSLPCPVLVGGQLDRRTGG